MKEKKGKAIKKTEWKWNGKKIAPNWSEIRADGVGGQKAIPPPKNMPSSGRKKRTENRKQKIPD